MIECECGMFICKLGDPNHILSEYHIQNLIKICDKCNQKIHISKWIEHQDNHRVICECGGKYTPSSRKSYRNHIHTKIHLHYIHQNSLYNKNI